MTVGKMPTDKLTSPYREDLMPVEAAPTARRLELPRRWELLKQRAQAAEADPLAIVERVDDAAARVDTLLRRVRDGGGGVIEVFFGLSGSGKTTFLQTLDRFFDGIRVAVFPRDRPLSDLPEYITKEHIPSDRRNRIILIDRRDNPSRSDLDLVQEMFGELLNVFREPEGAAVVLWPITLPESANFVAGKAWQTGRDSMADISSNGQYNFVGIEKGKWWGIADNTSRTLTGDSLDAFGITKPEADELLPKCETISDYFAAIVGIANEHQDAVWSVLKARVIPHLWVLLPGDDIRAVNATADALTQGVQSKIDIDKIGELIDAPDQTTIYVADWKKRRGQLAHLLRAIDVRLFGLPPNVSLAAIRSFGDATIKGRLKQQSASLDASKNAMKASRLYKAILKTAGVDTTAFAGARSIGKETIEEFLRVQAVAAKDDKPLNKALGGLIAECLKDDAPHLEVVSERKGLPGSSLQPDVQIKIGNGEYICLEPTWRTSGVGVEGEVKSAQNTLTEAHLKKYMLEKATQYVKDLEI